MTEKKDPRTRHDTAPPPMPASGGWSGRRGRRPGTVISTEPSSGTATATSHSSSSAINEPQQQHRNRRPRVPHHPPLTDAGAQGRRASRQRGREESGQMTTDVKQDSYRRARPADQGRIAGAMRPSRSVGPPERQNNGLQPQRGTSGGRCRNNVRQTPTRVKTEKPS